MRYDGAGFLRKYIFSTDHQGIGLQYGLTSLFFLLVGSLLVLIIRWQPANSGQPLPFIGGLLADNAPGGIVPPEFYNQLGAMHGTIMVFLGVVPLAVGAFGNYVLPLQIGAPDMAFPRWNLLSYWLYLEAASRACNCAALDTSGCEVSTPSSRRPTTTPGSPRKRPSSAR